MGDAFTRLYLEGAADGLSPLKAVAIFQEFRELTPTGGEGEELVLELADRLVAVDLLGKAAELLEDQVRFRLKGERRARAGAKLAHIRLMDEAPELAIEALRATAEAGLPEELMDERRLIQAQALVDLNQNGEALALLVGDQNRGATRLRADIHWKNANWPGAAEALARMLNEDWQGVDNLDADKSQLVLRLAVARLLAGDETGLARLARRYGGAMAETRYAADFALVTATPSGAADSVQAIATRVAEVDRFEAFLESYEARLRGRALAAK